MRESYSYGFEFPESFDHSKMKQDIAEIIEGGTEYDDYGEIAWMLISDYSWSDYISTWCDDDLIRSGTQDRMYEDLWEVAKNRFREFLRNYIANNKQELIRKPMAMDTE